MLALVLTGPIHGQDNVWDQDENNPSDYRPRLPLPGWTNILQADRNARLQPHKHGWLLK